MTRLPPLPGEEWTDETRAALAGLVARKNQHPQGAGVALSTLVRHPKLAKVFLPFSTYLLAWSTLPERLREVVTLRVARLRNSSYEWRHHVEAATKLGMSAAEIEAAGQGLSDDPLESLALTAVDELDGNSTLSDETWNGLGEHLSEQQRIDLIFTVGCYSLLAMAFNTFGIEPEE